MSRPKKYLTKVNKAQRDAAEAILREIWEKAFSDRFVEIKYSADDPANTHVVKRIHASLANYRTKMKRRPMENLELIAKLDSVTLSRPDPYTIRLEFNPPAMSLSMGQVILLGETHPHIVKGKANKNRASDFLPKLEK